MSVAMQWDEQWDNSLKLLRFLTQSKWLTVSQFRLLYWNHHIGSFHLPYKFRHFCLLPEQTRTRRASIIASMRVIVIAFCIQGSAHLTAEAFYFAYVSLCVVGRQWESSKEGRYNQTWKGSRPEELSLCHHVGYEAMQSLLSADRPTTVPSFSGRPCPSTGDRLNCWANRAHLVVTSAWPRPPLRRDRWEWQKLTQELACLRTRSMNAALQCMLGALIRLKDGAVHLSILCTAFANPSWSHTAGERAGSAVKRRQIKSTDEAQNAVATCTTLHRSAAKESHVVTWQT